MVVAIDKLYYMAQFHVAAISSRLQSGKLAKHPFRIKHVFSAKLETSSAYRF